MLENYLEPEQLLADESFLAWYFKTGEGADPGKEKDLEHWISAGAGRGELVQQAVRLLDSLRIREQGLPAGQAMAAEQALMDKIRQSSSATAGTGGILSSRRRLLAAAAIVTVIVSGALFTRSLLSGHSSFRTQYGEIRQRQLPDGTEVTINAHSELNYSTGWRDGVDREVWLKGEAWFHVRKTPLKSRFIVHTDHFDVIVTGTQFNVVNRDGRDNVMLQEGSVILHQPGCDRCADLSMKPGDYVEYGHSLLEKKTVRSDSLAAWKEQKLEFYRTPIRELVRVIRDQYGVDVKLADDSVKEKTINGILRNNNLDVLLQALEATGDFDVVRQNGDIVIRNHSQK
ncbi:MAG: FecR domain-containing protein [Bacteroidota bacterium]|nr:FecR domain-containing protein [Bacteroidota bacterium]